MTGKLHAEVTDIGPGRWRRWLDGTMRTGWQRTWYSALGLTLWITCCALGEVHQRFWSVAFAIATFIWMATIIAFLARDNWESRP